MSHMRTFYWLMAVVALGGVAIVGCSSQNQSEPSTGTITDADWTDGLSAEAVEAFSQLSDADRAAALKQRICPVADNPLGSMGAPYKVTVNGQDVFLCCDACETEVKSNPDKYLAKLNPDR